MWAKCYIDVLYSSCNLSKCQVNKLAIDPFHVRENVSKLEDKTKEI